MLIKLANINNGTPGVAPYNNPIILSCDGCDNMSKITELKSRPNYYC